MKSLTVTPFIRDSFENYQKTRVWQNLVNKKLSTL